MGAYYRSDGFADSQEEREFLEHLTETIVWCTRAGDRTNPKTSLRTFAPDLLRSPDSQVFSVCISRHWEVWSWEKRDQPLVSDLHGGRLIAYFPNDNMADGVAEAESQGFLDVNNIPPWDTWVCLARSTRVVEYEDNYLVAWVPPDFVELASAGIKINPDECIVWLDKLDNGFVDALKRLKLIR